MKKRVGKLPKVESSVCIEFLSVDSDLERSHSEVKKDTIVTYDKSRKMSRSLRKVSGELKSRVNVFLPKSNNNNTVGSNKRRGALLKYDWGKK